MPRYTIRGVTVEFPYEAYELQLAYMDRVIQSLQEKKHALLESPTGTGKTLCLLCATLAWRQDQLQKAKPGAETASERAAPPILYASRTHSQLCQAMKEIKKTKYRVKAAILGSRQQQCSNPALAKIQGTAKNYACAKKPLEQIHAHASKVLDLEDLSRKMAEISDIIFVPYNYLVDKRSRKSIESLFNHNVTTVIFDEAHNIEQSCSEAASFDLAVSVLSTAQLELERAVNLCGRRSEAEIKAENRHPKQQKAAKRPMATKSWGTLATRASTLKNMAKALEDTLTKMQITRDGKTYPGEFIFKLLSDACITDQNWEILTEALGDVADLLVDGPQSESGDTQYLASRLNGGSCSLLADALEKAFDSQKAPSAGAPPYHKAFRVHIRDEKATAGASRLVLSYWCFSPGIAMKRFVSELQTQNVILTSGTLSPMDSFAAELALPFPIRLENDHVISRDQALVRCVPIGPTGAALDSSYKCREDSRYKSDLGHAVVHFLKIIPGGVLMFFPSYVVLQSCLDHWKATKQGGMSIWDKILHVKAAVVEPRDPSMFPAKIREYQTHIQHRDGHGCILFAVCRGKVSEGIDFSDSAGRAVILAGIPYAQLADPKVNSQSVDALLKRAAGKVKEGIFGSTEVDIEWLYMVLSDSHDYGAILLCDRRFSQGNIQNQLSKWIRGYLSQERTFGTLLSSLTSFFTKDRSETTPEVQSRVEEVKSPTMAFKREAAVGDASVTVKKLRTQSPTAPHSEDPIPPTDHSFDNRKSRKTAVIERGAADPKAFLQEMKSELDPELFEQVRVLLAQLKVDRDVGGFQDALIELLAPEDPSQKLLTQFSVFIPASQRSNYATKLQTRFQSHSKSSSNAAVPDQTSQGQTHS